MIIHSYAILSLGLLLLGFISVEAKPSIAQTQCSGRDALTAKSCSGDSTSSDEQALFEMVSRYRAANGLPALRLSPGLSMVANRHIIDLVQNVKFFTHGWSNCPYDINVEKTWPCVSDSPTRLNSGYSGQAFETLFRTTTGKASPSQALDAWKKSKLHNSIILNLETFKNMPWDEMGVAMDSGYAVLWFGSQGRSGSTVKSGDGFGVSYEQALTGLNKLMSLQATSVSDATKWQGTSASKKIRLEIIGSPKSISRVSLSINLSGSRSVGTDDQKVIVTLLENLFPEWQNIDPWVASSVAAIADDSSVWRSKTVRGIKVDLRADSDGSLKLLVKP